MTRKINVGKPAECVSDDKKHFVSNSVKTARYTAFDFLPKQLYHQFSKFANLYFGFISILQAVPGWSPTGRFTTIVPLSIFVILSMAREAYDDYHRGKCDSVENNTHVKRYTTTSTPNNWKNSLSRLNVEEIAESPGSSNYSPAKASWTTVYWKNLRVGDIVKIYDKEFIPADLIILRTEKDDGICYIETANLDGETNYKMRNSLAVTNDFIHDDFWLSKLNATVSAEASNGNLYHFDGSLEFHEAGESQRFSLTVNQLALRGSTLANSGYIIGVVCYTGEESKIRMNANNSHRSKSPLMERFTNKIVLVLFATVLILAGFNTIASFVWERDVNKFGKSLWYLNGLSPDYAGTFFSFVILYNAFIPISLYVTLEMIKLVQIYFINHDISMYDRKSNRFAEAKTSAINEDLGQIQYIFSDKTGTLTENVMIFRKFCVLGKAFSLVKESDHTSVLFSREDFPVQDFTKDLRQLCDSSIVETIGDFKKGLDFLRSLALCHTCQFEKATTKNSTSSFIYQSSSPDEVALVSGAQEMRCIFKSRVANRIKIDCDGIEEIYMLQNTIEFSSKRKRMSVIYTYPDGRIVLLVKGADSVIIERLKQSEVHSNKLFDATTKIVDRFSCEGLRTLLYAYRELSQKEYTQWKAKYDVVSLSLENRVELVEEIAATIEIDLILLGATAIEDKLQAEVPETIEKIRRAGIRLWMLTGDKKETAINIGGVCNIIKPTSTLVILQGNTIREIESSLDRAILIVKEHKNPNSEASDGHIVAILEGEMFTKIQAHHELLLETIKNPTPENSILLRFQDMAVTCDNVICCRFSPSQKSVIVSLVKNLLNNSKDGSIGLFSTSNPCKTRYDFLTNHFKVKRFSGLTLAIGDGANDIPMMESAHVGIGITGREGLAAARASDYAIAQFRFLLPLLLVHGRYSYQRTALFTLGTFYKSLAFYTCQLYYQIWTGFSGTSLFEPWTLALYNILFSSLPVLVVGVFEKDLNISTLLNVPELYQSGQKNVYYNVPVFLRWMFQGFWHSACACMIPAIAFRAISTNFTYLGNSTGPVDSASLIVMGTISYTIVVVITVAKIGFIESHNWNIFTFLAASFTIGIWWLYQFVYADLYPALLDFGYDSKGLFFALERIQLTLWILVFLGTVVALGLNDFMIKCVQCMWSKWVGMMRNPLLSTPDNELLDDAIRFGHVGRSAGAERTLLDFGTAGVYAARVAREFEGDWTDAAKWFQEWERYHGISSSLGITDLICPEGGAVVHESRYESNCLTGVGCSSGSTFSQNK